MELSRRQFATVIGGLALAGLPGLARAGETASDDEIRQRAQGMVKEAHPPVASHAPKPETHAAEPRRPPATPEEIWADLMEGNRRFVAGKPRPRPLVAARKELVESQHPRVIVLSCSDSRVSPTLVFDKNLGDLFIVRTAGNVADPIAIGSIEYAADHLHSKVLLVMGHERCGGVAAAVSGEAMPTPNLDAIVRKIAPAVEKVRGCAQGQALMSLAIEANVRQSAQDLLEQSPILSREVSAGRLAIVKAVYRLRSGDVVRLA